MNCRVLKKKFYQEVIYNVHGVRNSRVRIMLRFISLCFKALGGALLTLVLAPISLFRPIEIWQMNTRLSKISFFIESLETGLRDLQSRNLAGRIWIIALYPINYPNRQLTKMYRRHMSILGKRQRWLAESARFVWPIFRVVKKSVRDRSQNKFIIWNAGKPTLKFNNREIQKGRDLDRNLDLSESSPYVCFSFPSKKYREIVDYGQTKMTPGKRNDLLSIIPELSSYLPVIRHLISNEISVVRMGVYEECELPKDLGPRVTDYAFNHRSEFGDVWLSSRCHFYLGAATGAHWLGLIFGKPVVQTDCYELRGTFGHNDLFIPQLSKFKSNNCYADFDWMARNQQWATDSDRVGTDYVIEKNTPEQIVDVCNEMILRLSGKWKELDEDEELQNRFRAVIKTFPTYQRAPARMGAKFLREHQHLLPQ